MMMSAFAMIMAGGPSPNLSVLSQVRAAPAVPFGGKYRVIDFCLSNVVNSNIFNVAVLTQFRPHSLNEHLGTGSPWDLDLSQSGLRILPPFRGGALGDWQKGTADAVRRNLDFVGEQNEKHVLILSGDHAYKMDYRPLLRQHHDSGADVTIATRKVPAHESHRYGMVKVAGGNRVVSYEEKPVSSQDTLANMGIYCFRREALIEMLKSPDFIDFGRDVLPAMVEGKYKVHSYRFGGYWSDLGELQAYWQANMNLLAEEPALALDDPEWVLHTRSQERAPVRVGEKAQLDRVLLTNGCQIEGEVCDSVLSPGVYIAPGAKVRNSILLNDVVVEEGAQIENCIIDKLARVGEGVRIGLDGDNTPNQDLPVTLNTGLTLVGRGSLIPQGVSLGKNVAIAANLEEGLLKEGQQIDSGHNLGDRDSYS